MGWTVRKHRTAPSGSTYIKLRRGDGAKLHVRVADHERKDWPADHPGCYDCRTQPHALLCCLRKLRHFRLAEPEPPTLTVEQEQAAARAMIRDIRRSAARPAVSFRRPAALPAWQPPAASTQAKPPHPRTMDPGQRLGEITDRWAELTDIEQAELLTALRALPTIAGKPHDSQRPMAAPVVDLVSRHQAAEALGVRPATLAAWVRRGWLATPEVLSNAAWYRRADVDAALERARKRRVKA